MSSLRVADTTMVALTPTSRAWVVVSTFLLGGTGVVQALLPNGRGLVPAFVMFIPASVITSACLRMRVRTDGEVITICNGFRTRHVRCSTIKEIEDRTDLNLGITTFAWYWSWRRRIWKLVLSDGSEVRVGVLTEMRSDGEWRPVGNVSAGHW
jgi:hypothetical protein